jgi:hypothetical protein
MSKYGKKAQEKVGEKLRKMKEGELETSHGRTVTDRNQVIAIALSEARREGGKVPPPPDEEKD